MAIQIACAAILSITNPGGSGVSACTGYCQSNAGYDGAGQEVDQVGVAGRAVRIMAVDAGSPVINYMFAVWERLITEQAPGIVALQAKAS